MIQGDLELESLKQNCRHAEDGDVVSDLRKSETYCNLYCNTKVNEIRVIRCVSSLMGE